MVAKLCGDDQTDPGGGVREGTPVIAGGGDQVMQGIGNGITQVGQASANIGTSGQLSFQADRAILNPQLSTNTFMGYRRDRWITMGAIMNAGLCYKWFSNLFTDTDYDKMNEKIAKSCGRQRRRGFPAVSERGAHAASRSGPERRFLRDQFKNRKGTARKGGDGGLPHCCEIQGLCG